MEYGVQEVVYFVVSTVPHSKAGKVMYECMEENVDPNANHR